MSGQEIEIAEVEPALTRLWAEIVRQGGEGAAPALMRANTLNLIVAGCGSEGEGLFEVLSRITRRHPCRALVITTDESRAAARASVNMLCHPGGRGQPQICSESVVLSAPSSQLHEIFGSIAGLLPAGVPTFVWWRARLPESGTEQERFNHLARLGDRFLFDSALCAGADIQRIAAFVSEGRVRAVGDINWARLTPWRAQVARVFDPPAARELLGRLEWALIGHQGPRADAAARLMAGWLRSRLGRLRIEFAPASQASLELHAGGQVFTVPCPPLLDETQALSAELALTGRDEIFEQALARVERLTESA